MVPVVWFCDRVRQRDLSAGIRSRDHGVLTCRCSSAKSSHFLSVLYCEVLRSDTEWEHRDPLDYSQVLLLLRRAEFLTFKKGENGRVVRRFGHRGFEWAAPWLLNKTFGALTSIVQLWVCDVWNFPIRCSRLKTGQIYPLCTQKFPTFFNYIKGSRWLSKNWARRIFSIIPVDVNWKIWKKYKYAK